MPGSRVGRGLADFSRRPLDVYARAQVRVSGGKICRKLTCFSRRSERRPRGCLEVAKRSPTGPQGAPWAALWPLLASLGLLLGRSWLLLGRSWAALGRSWPLKGLPRGRQEPPRGSKTSPKRPPREPRGRQEPPRGPKMSLSHLGLLRASRSCSERFILRDHARAHSSVFRAQKGSKLTCF